MNYIFRTYPEHPWFSNWTVEPRGCSASFRDDTSSQFFKTGETVGRILPNHEKPEWALQIPTPQNSRINLLFNGFCAYLEQRKKRFGAEVLSPEPGVLLGRYDAIPDPVLASEHPIETEDGSFWIDSDHFPAFLICRNNVFCLVTRFHLKKDAQALAETYLDKDFEEMIAEELAYRAGAEKLFEEMIHHDSLAAICAESMMKSLRPPEGMIPLPWVQSSKAEQPEFNVNELYPTVLAWRLIDIETAEQLISCTLKIQTNSGAIPVKYSPHATHSVLEAPKPLLAKTVETIWKVRKDDELLNQWFPQLRRHLQWMLHHFDPKRNNHYCWKNSQEPFVQGEFKNEQETVDIAVLLLTEIEAFDRLKKQSSRYGADPDLFEKQRIALESSMIEQFWNEESSGFTNAFFREHVEQLNGFGSFTPLIWNDLPARYKTTMLDKIRETGTLPGGLSVLSWRKNALDDSSFPLLQQLLVFQALSTSDPNGQLLNDFSRVTLQGFVEWQTLSLDEKKELSINPELAAFIMNVQSLRQYRYHAKGRTTGAAFSFFKKVKGDRFDLIVILATLLTLFGVKMIYSALQAAPPLEELQAQMNAAYANRNAKTTLINCASIIKNYPDEASTARLYAANISMLQQDYPAAEELYAQIREQLPDNPAAMIGLGLACQLQNKTKQANENYEEFTYLFNEIFPDVVTEVDRFRQLMQEGFSTPPKWQDIYRYQMMHEL